jgi:mono/diheme cytochrome c family protein
MTVESKLVVLRGGLLLMLVLVVLIGANAAARAIEGVRLNPWESYHATGAGVARGASVMRSHGCFACHSLGGYGGDIAPKLDGVSRRRAREYLFRWIKSPIAIKPNTIMPTFDLTDEQILDVISFLETR